MAAIGSSEARSRCAAVTEGPTKMDDIPPSNRLDVDDLEAAIREGRGLHPARAYRIKVADETLNFRPIEVIDPMPLGRQILEAAGGHSIDEFSVFALMPDGDFEDVRLDELFDLRGRGTEKFIIFRTDRLFKFTIDNRQMEWGKPLISGLIVRRLAAVGPEYALCISKCAGDRTGKSTTPTSSTSRSPESSVSSRSSGRLLRA
jgi:hypothetical protein